MTPTTPATPTQRSWRLSPFLQGSLAVHAAAAAGLLAWPQAWPWAVGALAADHGALTLAGLLPRCDWLGPNHTRLPAAAVARREIALTLDDGPHPEVTPRVLDLLDQAGAKASFFCIAAQARRHPQLCREIVARGHSVENHSNTHSHTFSVSGPRRVRAEVLAAQQTLADLTGQAPRFFRAPAGLRNVFLEPVLAELGLQLTAWTRRAYDTREARPDVVLQRLQRGLGAGDILLLHDGNPARCVGGEPVVWPVLPRLLQAVTQQGLRPVSLPQAFF